jgi:hypothetical protein
VIGTCRKALDHTVQQPCETDAHRTADLAERDALPQQTANQCALLRGDGTVFRSHTKLTSTGFAVMVLLAMARMAIFLEPC